MRWTVQRDRASRFPSPTAPSCCPRNAKSEEVLACIGDAAAQERGKRDAPYRSPISSFLLHFPPSHCQFVTCSLSLSLCSGPGEISRRGCTLKPLPGFSPSRAPTPAWGPAGDLWHSRDLALAPRPLPGRHGRQASRFRTRRQDSGLSPRNPESSDPTRAAAGRQSQEQGRGLGGEWRGHRGPSRGEKISPAVPVSRHLQSGWEPHPTPAPPCAPRTSRYRAEP